MAERTVARSAAAPRRWRGVRGSQVRAIPLLWTEKPDHDTFQWFKDHGGLTRANGQRFREMVLSQGSSQDYATMYKAFTGRDPSVEPMLVARGLKAPK